MDNMLKQSISREKSIMKPADFTKPEELFQMLIQEILKYHPSADTTMIEKAYQVAAKSHEGQLRKSGEPYIIHPICVALILAELEMDKETIAAGLLHDVIEDTAVTIEELTEQFGSEVALLVDGVTKLTQLSYSIDKVEEQVQNLRKMFLAMAKDIRVIIIKLADRLHNMRTLKYRRQEKQKEIARETMDIYAPIADRLGISKIKIELDDLSLKYSQPDVYYDLVEKISLTKERREAFIEDVVEELKQNIEAGGIEANIDGRIKHFFSIYRKMINQNKTLDQIYDLFAVRIIVDSVRDCYAALGVIHDLYKPIPGRFKDYIAMPKPNMYQSLHTTLIASNGQPFEVQIRTLDMHKTAEFGIAAHWKYKEGHTGTDVEKGEEKLSWLRQILEWQRDTDSREFLVLLKNDLDLFSENIYCFTPKGEVKNLPNGSNTIDFAYSIHSSVGNRMIGARVNGKLVPIDYSIENGDRIEILTSQNSKGPSRDWLNIVRSTQAKNKINQWFKVERKEDNIIRGKEMLDKYLKAKGLSQMGLLRTEYAQIAMKKYGFRDWDSLLAAIGHGGLKEGQIVNKLQEEYEKKRKKEVTDEEVLKEASEQESRGEKIRRAKARGGIVVKGVGDLAVRFSRCCSPVPGDEIVGFVTRGRGISIHRTDCINMIHLSELERVRMIDAEWEDNTGSGTQEAYMAEIRIFANNRTGILADISKILTEHKIDVIFMNSRRNRQGMATISMAFDIHGKEELNKVIAKLKSVESIIEIERTSG